MNNLIVPKITTLMFSSFFIAANATPIEQPQGDTSALAKKPPTADQLPMPDELLLRHVYTNLGWSDICAVSGATRKMRGVAQDRDLEFDCPVFAGFKKTLLDFDKALENVVKNLQTREWTHTGYIPSSLYSSAVDDHTIGRFRSLCERSPLARNVVRLVGSDPIALKYIVSYREFLKSGSFLDPGKIPLGLRGGNDQAENTLRFIYDLSRLRHIDPTDSRRVHTHLHHLSAIHDFSVPELEVLLRHRKANILSTDFLRDILMGLEKRKQRGARATHKLLRLIAMNAEAPGVSRHSLLSSGICEEDFQTFIGLSSNLDQIQLRERLIHRFVEESYTPDEFTHVVKATNELAKAIGNLRSELNIEGDWGGLLLSFVSRGVRASVIETVLESDSAMNYLKSAARFTPVGDYLERFDVMGCTTGAEARELIELQKPKGTKHVFCVNFNAAPVVKELRKNGSSLEEAYDFILYFENVFGKDQFWSPHAAKERTNLLTSCASYGATLPEIKRAFEPNRRRWDEKQNNYVPLSDQEKLEYIVRKADGVMGRVRRFTNGSDMVRRCFKFRGWDKAMNILAAIEATSSSDDMVPVLWNRVPIPDSPSSPLYVKGFRVVRTFLKSRWVIELAETGDYQAAIDSFGEKLDELINENSSNVDNPS